MPYRNLLSLKCFSLATCIVIGLLTGPLVRASDDSSDSEIGYDQIVNDLSQPPPVAKGSNRVSLKDADKTSSLDNVLMHGGIGFSNMFESVTLPNADQVFVNQRGVQASLGIDLFSENWTAEGIARSFGQTEYTVSTVAVKEFDLMVFYKNKIAPRISAKIGAGLGGRYMHVTTATTGESNYSTPTSVATLGADLYLSNAVSIGSELSARNTMTGDTIDRHSYDITVRVDAHF